MAGFHMNDLFSGGWNPGNFFWFTRQSFSTSIATQRESGTEVLQMQAECKYKFMHTELVI